MLVAAVGTIQAPLKVNKERQKISFTLKTGASYFLVSTVGLAQFNQMTELAIDQQSFNVLIIGYAFSIFNKRCGQHHTGIAPLVLVPFSDVAEIVNLQDIISQWFTASLHEMSRNNGKTIVELAQEKTG